MRKQLHKASMSRSRRRRFSPLVFVGMIVPVVLVMVAGASFAIPHLFQTHAAAAVANPNCTLIVPANPLLAPGLATPYQLKATDAAAGPCNEANAKQAAFVQGAVFDPATGQISIYNPLVIDQGTKPAAAPVVPAIPAGSTVGLWFGFNGTNLTLQDANGSLQQGVCVNGSQGTIFGQFAYCNAPAFFAAANNAALKPVIPALAMGNDKLTCPTVRDFGVVDQDQSDNVTTTYMINGTAQVNGSDNRLLAIALDGALGCTPLTAPDLANPGGPAVPALPLNELQAAAQQQNPATVPLGDPMTMVNNTPNTTKTTDYRAGVNQPAANANNASTMTYCTNLSTVAPSRIATDAPLTGAANSPDVAAGNTLFTFLAQRFQTTFEGVAGTGLACAAAGAGPIQAQKDAAGVAISATIKVNGTTTCFNSQGVAQAAPAAGTMDLCMKNAAAAAKAAAATAANPNAAAPAAPAVPTTTAANPNAAAPAAPAVPTTTAANPNAAAPAAPAVATTTVANPNAAAPAAPVQH